MPCIDAELKKGMLSMNETKRTLDPCATMNLTDPKQPPNTPRSPEARVMALV